VEKKAGGCAQRCIRAVSFEDIVWRFVSDLLKDPDRIRAGIEKLVESERNGGSVDTGRDALYWAGKVAECSHLRSAYQDQQAARLMTLEELGSKLKELEQTRKVAEAEIAALSAREERARQLDADRDSLVASYAATVPEALDSLAGEERSRVYRMLNLEVKPGAEGYEVSGALCNSQPTGKYRSAHSSGSPACGPYRFGDRGRSGGGRRSSGLLEARPS
jgi:hypothetical protein